MGQFLLLGVLIGKGTWGPLATEVLSLGVGSELEDSSLGELSGWDDLLSIRFRYNFFCFKGILSRASCLILCKTDIFAVILEICKLCWSHSRLFKLPDTYEDISGVGDGSDDSGGNHELLPCLGEVDDVNTLVVALEHVSVHQTGAVLSADLDLNSIKIRRMEGDIRQQRAWEQYRSPWSWNKRTVGRNSLWYSLN